jgi:hypothetical protein
LFSVKGKKLYSDEIVFSANNSKNTIDIKDLPQGVYLVSITNGSVLINKKFIKK